MVFNVVLTDRRSKCIHLNGALLTGDSGGGERGRDVAFPEKGSARGQARGCQKQDKLFVRDIRKWITVHDKLATSPA